MSVFDLVGIAGQAFAGVPGVWIAPEVPAAPEAEARAAHAVHLPERERVLVLHATDGGGEGFVATSERFGWKNRGQNPRQIGWDELRAEMIRAGAGWVEIARGEVAVKHEAAAALAAFLGALAERVSHRRVDPYREAARVEEPQTPGIVPVRRVVALAREHLGEVPEALYAPSIPAARLRQVRHACTPFMDEADEIAVLYGAVVEGQDGDGFVLTGDRLHVLGVGRNVRRWLWRHLEPHTIHLDDERVSVMGVTIPLDAGASSGVATQVTALFRQLAIEAGSEDVT